MSSRQKNSNRSRHHINKVRHADLSKPLPPLPNAAAPEPAVASAPETPVTSKKKSAATPA